MSDPIKQLMKDMLDVKRRLARLEANDSFEFEPWTAWTPELYGGSTPGTITYTQQEGYYMLIDAMVFVYGRLVVNAVTVGPTGGLRIRTLPYTPSASANNPPVYIQARLNLSAGYSWVTGNIPNALTFIVVTENGDNTQQNFPSASLAAGDDVRFAGFYRID